MEAGTATGVARLERSWEEPGGWREALLSVDHKRIGVRYMVTSAAFFVLAGLAALAMRGQLAQPAEDLLGPGAFNELFTLHGVTMIFLFVTPMLSGFGNYLVPLMIGARDMAFPRLNALSYWIFLFSGLFIYSSVVAGAIPNDGWFNYVPLSSERFSPGSNIDFYTLGLIFLGISTTAGAVNFIVTIFRMRAPGMSIDRMPLFCWAVLATSFAILFAIPSLTAANAMLELERNHGFHFFEVAFGGDPLLWQHMFWIFGHPDVYIIFLPAVGMVSTIVPVFSRRPMVAYWAVAVAMGLTAFIGFGVWVHHMFVVGLPQIAVALFAAASLVIAIPSGVQVFAWIATIWTGRPVIRTPFLYVIGFVVVFVIGGITGVMFAVVPFDQQVTDSYFVVAHFHYVLFGGAVFPILAGLHYWLPKITGRMPSEALGRWSFWLVFAGFNLTFFPMHVSGLLGMPRRVYTYTEDSGFEAMNLLASLGAAVLTAGLLVVLFNLVRGARSGPPAGPDPWGADTLEWSTSSPPPAYDFATLPRVFGPHPLWDGRSETAAGPVAAEGHQTGSSTPVDAVEDRRLHMPRGSGWPPALAGSLGAVFVGLITGASWLAFAGLGAAAVSALLWLRPAGGYHEPPPEADRPPGERDSAWWGMALFIATESMLCLSLVAAYVYTGVRTHLEWPPATAELAPLARPLALTALALAAGATARLAVVEARRGRARPYLGWLAAATAAALGFCLLGAVELGAVADAFHPSRGSYESVFNLLTWVHLGHAVLGLAMLAWLLVWARGAASRPAELSRAEAVGLYWLFVPALWLVVLFVLYLSPRL